MRTVVWAMTAAIALAGCSKPAQAPAEPAKESTGVFTTQTGQGQPYVLTGTQVWDVPDPVSRRKYQVFVSLPPSYETSPDRRYPVLYITDADYGFPLIRSVARRVNLDGPQVEEFILVGLSYSDGDSGADSRRRDYTPTVNGPSTAPKGAVHGQSAAYRKYVREQALPFVEGKFRADPARRVFMGHSYGGLLGAEILFNEPTLFSAYILGSPSFWYDAKHMLKVERDYALTHKDLPAKVFMYMGGFETIRAGDRRYNRDKDMVGDMRRFEEQLKSRGYPGLTISSEVLPGEDHLTVFPSGFTRGLLQTLPAR